LRSRLAEPGAIVALGAHDGLTARIAERSGVEALYHGGYALAAHHFGLPDVGLVCRAEGGQGGRRRGASWAGGGCARASAACAGRRTCRSSSTPTPATAPRPACG